MKKYSFNNRQLVLVYAIFLMLNLFINSFSYSDVSQVSNVIPNNDIVVLCAKDQTMTPTKCLESSKPSYTQVGCQDLANGSCSEVDTNIKCFLKSSNCKAVQENNRTCPNEFRLVDAIENVTKYSVFVELCIKN